MKQSKYDVFISYYRKDYVNERGNVDEKWGFIDTNGVVVVPCQRMFAMPFVCGLARVKDSDGKWCKIIKTGNVIGQAWR